MDRTHRSTSATVNSSSACGPRSPRLFETRCGRPGRGGDWRPSRSGLRPLAHDLSPSVRSAVTHPSYLQGMEPMLVIALLIAFVTIAAVGICAGVLVTRHRAGAESGSLDGVVERVVSIAGESFDSRLQTGTAELEHRRQAIDDHLEAVVTSLAEKIDSVDKLVAERVGGMSETVGERVGGMSKSLGHQVQTMGNELSQLRNLVAQLQRSAPNSTASSSRRSKQPPSNSRCSPRPRSTSARRLPAQARGQWGERMAEDVLRAAGMREGINYRKQRAIEGGTRPDFTFLLPDDQHLHMDVKFPVDNYLRALEAPSEAEAVMRRDRFLKDVRDRVKELNGAAIPRPTPPSATCCSSSPTRASTASFMNTTHPCSTTPLRRRSSCARRPPSSRCLASSVRPWTPSPSNARQAKSSMRSPASSTVVEIL